MFRLPGRLYPNFVFRISQQSTGKAHNLPSFFPAVEANL